jgi:hypothetical protein
MIILQKYKHPREDDPQDWFEISLERAIHLLEGGGHWQQGTVQEMFENGLELFDRIARYKVKEDQS